MNSFYDMIHYVMFCEPRSGHSVEALRNSGLKRLITYTEYIGNVPVCSWTVARLLAPGLIADNCSFTRACVSFTNTTA